MRRLVFILLLLACAPLARATTVSPAVALAAPDGQRAALQAAAVSLRTATGSMGFSGVMRFVVLDGPRASLRLTSPLPRFIVAAPRAQAIQLARFDIRRAATREARLGGQYGGAARIAANHLADLRISPASDQSGAPAGMQLYDVTPRAPLAPGEYALAVGARRRESELAAFYDFAVD